MGMWLAHSLVDGFCIACEVWLAVQSDSYLWDVATGCHNLICGA